MGIIYEPHPLPALRHPACSQSRGMAGPTKHLGRRPRRRKSLCTSPARLRRRRHNKGHHSPKHVHYGACVVKPEDHDAGDVREGPDDTDGRRTRSGTPRSRYMPPRAPTTQTTTRPKTPTTPAQSRTARTPAHEPARARIVWGLGSPSTTHVRIFRSPTRHARPHTHTRTSASARPTQPLPVRTPHPPHALEFDPGRRHFCRRHSCSYRVETRARVRGARRPPPRLTLHPRALAPASTPRPSRTTPHPHTPSNSHPGPPPPLPVLTLALWFRPARASGRAGG
ncbi:hypothetical protein B0H16DRAFT_1542137 [Mycena metata]|uniref:Uncharacterized protein n=1 Tax=Mycena metata TaxID=1033252 RepID=A0AAD7J1B3_9AGAR|nr:hypothetical protein B0H16DRAFT_1542137 [Mycena metata]